MRVKFNHAEIVVESLVLCTIIFAGFFLRVYNLDKESLWYDEIVSYSLLDAPDLRTYMAMIKLIHADNGPVYYILQFFWGNLFNVSICWMRLLSVLCGTTAIPALYGFARHIGGKRVATISSLLLAISPLHIWHSQALRPYPLLDVLMVISLFLLLRLNTTGGSKFLFSNIVLNALLVWIHPFMVFSFPAQWLFLALHWRHRRRIILAWTLASAIILASIMLWVYSGVAHIPDKYDDHFQYPGVREALLYTAGFDSLQVATEFPVAYLNWWRGRPVFGPELSDGTISSLPSTLYTLLPTATMSFLRSVQIIVDLVLIGVVLCILGWLLWKSTQVSLLAYRGLGPLSERMQAVFLLAGIAILPMASMFAASYFWRPCLELRFMLYSSLGVYLGLGMVWKAIPRRGVGFIVFLLVFLVYIYQLFFLVPNNTRTDWYGVARLIEKHKTAEELILVTGNFPAFAPVTLQSHIQHPDITITPAYSLQDIYDKMFRHFAKPNSISKRTTSGVWSVVELTGYEYDYLRNTFDTQLKQHGIEYQSWLFPGMMGLAVFHFRQPLTWYDTYSLPQAPSNVDYTKALNDMGVLPENPKYEQYKNDLHRICDKHFHDIPVMKAMYGLMLVEEKLYDTALMVSQAATERHPDYPISHLALTVAHYANNDYDSAWISFEKGLGISDVYLRILTPFFRALLQEEDKGKAYRYLESLQVQGYPYDILFTLVNKSL